jgi:hypothetical protein
VSDRVRVYLAGAIRDGVDADINWREGIVSALGDKALFLNPLGGKTYHPDSPTGDWIGRWRMANNVVPVGSVIVPHDFWCVRQADVVLANFESMAEGYPSIGTLVEWGYACALGKLRYAIAPEGSAAATHPFIVENATVVFPNVPVAIAFLRRHLDVLSGADPHFDGVVRG